MRVCGRKVKGLVGKGIREWVVLSPEGPGVECYEVGTSGKQ